MLCRLCDGPTRESFRLRVLSKHDVLYFLCQHCRSLQSQEPFWLEEAYRHPSPHPLDVGAAQRVLQNRAAMQVLASVLNARRILDFGGGDGLLCRLLRDRNLDAYASDKYATLTYASAFAAEVSTGFDIISAFEVVEHLPHPRQDLGALFASRPRYLVFSTELYSQQGSDWWYLSPETGQHIFFFSDGAMRLLSEQYKYSYYKLNGWHLFSRELIPAVRLLLIRRLTGGRPFRLVNAYLSMSDTWQWVMRDYNKVSAALQGTPTA